MAGLACTGLSATAQDLVQINTGPALSPLYAVGPVYVSSTLFYKFSRYAYLYTADELAAAGITPGSQILGVGWMKSTANSTQGPAVFKIYMKNSSTVAYSDANAPWNNLSAGATMVYQNAAQAIPATATPHYIDFPLDQSFTYNGGSLEILTEWDISMGPSPIATGSFEWENTTVVDRIYGKGGTSLPSELSSTDNNTSIDNRRPVIQLTLDMGTAVVGLAAEGGIGLFPNPADRVLNIMNRTGASFTEVAMFDLLGRPVRTGGMLPDRGTLQLAVDGLAPGTYLLRMDGQRGTMVKRFQVR
ncbi:MAG: T9SS type A sorting domain-containing protein [Flavobacteriales bacterium]|nr:T9SS type A sorting domain-containing protein [Flavobacteriales bacterium]MEB2341999.1 T9SS type A sorting domain-containing protein [Flavobacteriia bacterium]